VVSHADPELFRRVFDRFPSAVVVTDADTVITAWNPAAERLLGWPAAEAVGHSTIELAIPPADRGQAREYFERVVAGQPWEGAFPVCRKDGAVLLLRLTVAPITDGAGTLTGTVITARDAADAQTEHERAQLRLSLLSRAGSLLAASLDLDATLAAVADVLVPAVADHCAIDLLDDRGQPMRVALVHAPGTGGRPSDWLGLGPARYPYEHPVSRALRTGLPAQLDGLETLDPAPYAPVPEGVAHSQRIGLHAMVALPLRARGETRGALCVVSSVSKHDYTPDDLALLADLADRAGLAIDNAARYTEQRELALTLQHSLLPSELPRLDGLLLASRYRPSSSAEVGGDWYDAIPLSAGRVGLTIGDVQGRGARAAAVMGQIRTGLRALSALDLEPAAVLGQLDRLVTDLEGELLASCLYAVYDPWSRELLVAAAGHPPPLLAAGESCEELPVEPGVPLGVGGVPFTQASWTLPPDATLLLYTDGLCERRDLGVDHGWRMLCSAAGDAAGDGDDVEAFADLALAAVPGPVGDDGALLVVRTEKADLPVLDVELDLEPEAIGAARSDASAAVRGWGLPEAADTVELLVSELATNALRHATARPGPDPEAADLGVDDGLAAEPLDRTAWLRLRRGADAVFVEVFDRDPRLPRLRWAGLDDEDGRGLYLVDILATRWGARPTADGKAVWCELVLS
jgi:PAS domain S-box-containing protein